MRNLLVSAAIALLVFVPVALWLSPMAGMVPAFLGFLITFIVITRRLTAKVQEEMAALPQLLQSGKIKPAQEKLRYIQKTYGPWQPMLTGQIEAQLGMIDYVQMRFKQALPQLEQGTFRNHLALLCIGAIHYREKRMDEAWATFKKARSSAKKETIVYLTWATLLARSGQRDKALHVLSDGLKVMPENAQLKNLRSTIANKKKINTKSFPDIWAQIFPEERVDKQALLMGRRAGPRPGHGFSGMKMSRHQSRRR
jgi:tetratricopeptide (TPR) repeat protein